MRTKTVLSAAESAIVSNIPECQKALALYANLTEGIFDARKGRLLLGRLLVKVHDQIAEKGPRGLFSKWMLSVGIDRSRGYRSLHAAAPTRFAANKAKPSVQLRMRVLDFLGKIKKADGPKKTVLFDQLVSFLRKNWLQ